MYDNYIFSTGTHYISNSGSDERGKYSGGTAGDQTGNEWVLKAWYNRPWNCVLRHPRQNVQQKLAELACAAALNNLVGYDQNQRSTYWNHLKASNYDPSQITVACEADCSAGVIANIKACGYLIGIDALKNFSGTYTGNMRSAAANAGFQVLTDSKYLTGTAYLLPGDILLNDSHHVCTNITKGSAASWSTYSATTTTSTTTTTTSSVSGNVTGLAREVIRGEWGNGSDRISRITTAVQSEVNRLLGAGSVTWTGSSEYVTGLAREVIKGLWGNGSDRITKITTAVQQEVNRLLA